MSQQNPLEILVIGAGPAGLSVAAEATYHGFKSVLVLEKGADHNQTVRQYYPEEKRVDASYKGQEAICAGVFCFRDTTKKGFLEHVDRLMRSYAFPFAYSAHVDSIKRHSDGLFSVTGSDGTQYVAEHVVIAVGRMGKPNRPDFFSQIPPAVRKEVRFDLQNINPEGKRILIVGGGNTAVEFALSLTPKAEVSLSYRKKEFTRLNPMNKHLLEGDETQGRLKVLRGTNITAVGEKNGKPLAIFAEREEMQFDHIVFAIGGSSPTAFLQNAGIELDDRKNPKLNEWLETNVPNLFVAGELSVPQGKGSIIVSFNSGQTIVEGIMRKLGRSRNPQIVSFVPLP
ncbi:MAG: NAD(P)-binding domain-containing protein [Bdellovibrionales bacterium]|nr:NAD(P)-binding domain-containing protein [Bdellovibrionales bacterium]